MENPFFVSLVNFPHLIEFSTQQQQRRRELEKDNKSQTHLQIISSRLADDDDDDDENDERRRENLMKIIFQNKFNLTCKTFPFSLFFHPSRRLPCFRELDNVVDVDERREISFIYNPKLPSLSSVIYFIFSGLACFFGFSMVIHCCGDGRAEEDSSRAKNGAAV